VKCSSFSVLYSKVSALCSKPVQSETNPTGDNPWQALQDRPKPWSDLWKPLDVLQGRLFGLGLVIFRFQVTSGPAYGLTQVIEA
jgi:hypothetical protein